jgi:hypothetical protein
MVVYLNASFCWHKMELSGQLHAPVTLILKRGSWYAWGRRLYGPQSRLEIWRRDKYHYMPWPGKKSQISECPATNLLILLPQISILQMLMFFAGMLMYSESKLFLIFIFCNCICKVLLSNIFILLLCIYIYFFSLLHGWCDWTDLSDEGWLTFSCGYMWIRVVCFIFFIASGVGLNPFYCGHIWPIVRARDNRWGWLWTNWRIEDWKGKPKYSEKTAPAPLCPPQIPLDQIRDRTRAAAVGSQRLTAWAMARPLFSGYFKISHLFSAEVSSHGVFLN